MKKREIKIKQNIILIINIFKLSVLKFVEFLKTWFINDGVYQDFGEKMNGTEIMCNHIKQNEKYSIFPKTSGISSQIY